MSESGPNANDIILQEMLSMGRDPATEPIMKPSSHAFASMVLEDDVDDSGSGEVAVAAVANLSSSTLLSRSEGRPAPAVVLAGADFGRDST